MYTLVMAEGGYDPTNENENPWEDRCIDHDGDDDDDDYEVKTTGPFKPGATSTPYHGGEEHEMAHMGPEQEGLGDEVPLVPEYDEFVDKETLVERFKDFIKKKRPRVDFRRIVIGLGKKQGNKGKPVAFGPKGGETVIFKQDGNLTAAFSKQYSDALGSSAEEIIAEDRQTQQ